MNYAKAWKNTLTTPWKKWLQRPRSRRCPLGRTLNRHGRWPYRIWRCDPQAPFRSLAQKKPFSEALKTGARPPKHGLIFQHTLLHDAKRWQRGKIARVIAGKLAIAARTDAFGAGHYIGDKLKAEINKRIEEIQSKYKEPPPPKRS